MIITFSSVWGNIFLNGYLHPGDNDRSSFIPTEPLTLDNKHTYDYYLNNPTKFYLSEDSNITAVELVNAVDIDSAIRVYIDGNLVGTGSNANATVPLDTTLSLGSGYHDIAVRGSCYDRRGNEINCASRRVRDIDDFDFSGITLLSSQTSTAYHFIQRRHTGDDNDDDDNYDIDETQYSYYPDAFESQIITYTINDTNSYAGFEIYLSRVRDVHQNGVNKLTVYDTSGGIIASYDLNNSSTDTFDLNVIYDNNISNIGSVTISSGYTGSFIDDISFGELILIPLSSADLQERKKPLIDYHFDECFWDNDTTTYEIKNSGTLGNDYNATALNDVNISEGKICSGGDFTDGQKAIIAKNPIYLPGKYTLTTWVKFPLSSLNHTSFREGRGRNRINVYYYNIADKTRSRNDYIYFKEDQTNSIWYLCVVNTSDECQEYNPQNLNGWNLLSFRVSSSGTLFDVNGINTLTFTQAPNGGSVGLLYNSDYSANDDVPNGQSLGTLADEFRLYNRILDTSELQQLLSEIRTCPNCGGSQNKTTSYNAVSSLSASQCNAVNDWDNNLTTQIVKQPFNLWILSKEEANATTSSEANVTKVELKFYGGGNGTDCDNATYKSSQALCDDASVTICQDTNASGCMLLSNVNLGNASRCIQVYIEGKDINNTSSDINTSYSSDDFANRPKKFVIITPATSLHAGEDFNLTFQALNANDENSTDYNETRGASFAVDANITNTNCNLGNFSLNTFSFSNGQKNDVNASYSEVGDLNITIKEINGSEYAKVDADDTPDTQRVIEKNSIILSFSPYQFSIINYAFTRNNPDADWRYMADVNESNISISFNIQAQNKQNQTTQNFDAECADENVSVKIDLNVTNDDANASYFEHINNTQIFGHDKNLSDINFSGTVNDNNFTNGNSSDIIYALNVYRVYNQVKNPRTIEVLEVNTTSPNVKNIGLSPENNSSAFYYARLYTQDLSTSKTPDTIQAKVLVYDSLADNYVSDLNLTEELSNWYHYVPQNNAPNGNILALNVSKTTSKKSADDDGISATSTFDGNATFTITVDNPNENTQTHYIHLDVSPWIWYVYENFGSDYNESVGSSCSEHPCIKYNYHKTNNANGVSSGNVKGVTFDVNVSKNSRGIRLLR